MNTQNHHWISFTNQLSSQDVGRIRRTVQALAQGGKAATPFQPDASSGGGASSPLAGGGRKPVVRTPPSRALSYRVFYRVHASGKPVSKTKYEVRAGGPDALAHEWVEKALGKQTPLVTHSATVPRTVRAAVSEAVQRQYMTPRQGEAYMDRYLAHKSMDDHVLVYLREQGSSTVREYEGCFRMLKHPSPQDVRDGCTRRLVVNHVDTFRRTA
jgi:hypothetical protein